eukprot:3232873-Pyramimonas_sp.AAC.1
MTLCSLYSWAPVLVSSLICLVDEPWTCTTLAEADLGRPLATSCVSRLSVWPERSCHMVLASWCDSALSNECANWL